MSETKELPVYFVIIAGVRLFVCGSGYLETPFSFHISTVEQVRNNIANV